MLERVLTGLCLLLAPIVVSCERVGDDEAAPDETVTLEESQQVDDGGYYHKEGNFRVFWPTGCSKLGVRTLPAPTEDDPNRLAFAHVYCNRSGSENEGCAVTVHFDIEDDFGGPPTPRHVIDLVKELIDHFQVRIVRQQPIQRGTLEGIMVQCEEPGNTGSVWIEGFLVGANAYLVSAWKPTGVLFNEPEYMRFFESFTLVHVTE